MNKIYTIFAICILSITALNAQSTYLTSNVGYKADDTISSMSFSAFDVLDTLLYGNDGDTIRCYNLKTGIEFKKFGKPVGYSSYPSFVTLSPDGKEIWVGFTISGNTDDRIYCIDNQTGTWELKAVFPANFDLEFCNDSILVSGLNSTLFSDPNSIFVLDTTGNNDHRKIIEIGAYAAGFAKDAEGNIYSGTSDYVNPNVLYRWDATSVNTLISNVAEPYLATADAIKLSDLPAGTYDCEIDDGNNLLFNFNSSEKVIAKWNGTVGNGNNFDTIAWASNSIDWLTMLKSTGDITIAEPGNFVFAHSFGRPISIIHKDYPVVQINDNKFSETDSDLRIYPNPAKEKIKVTIENQLKTELRIYNITGTELYTDNNYTGNYININGLMKGAYIVEIRQNGSSVYKKFIKQ